MKTNEYIEDSENLGSWIQWLNKFYGKQSEHKGRCDDCKHAQRTGTPAGRVRCMNRACPALIALIVIPSQWDCGWFEPQPWLVRLVRRVWSRMRHAV